MSLSSEELLNVQNSVLEYNIKDKPEKFYQHITDKPLLRAMKAKVKEFVGGRDRTITAPVAFKTHTVPQMYEYDDIVGFGNPATTRRVFAQWRQMHVGIECTETELLQGGITINDQMKASYNQGELTILNNLLEDKTADMMEGFAAGLWGIYWRDGSQDSKAPPGIMAYVQDDPSVPLMVAGIDQYAEPKWRNRVSLNLSTTTPADLVITKKLQSEYRQLTKFGGKPTVWLAGSAFLDAIEAEIYSKGVFTQAGWNTSQSIALDQAHATLRGITLEYEPYLDDMGRSKYCYALDIGERAICPFVLSGESEKLRKPLRAHDQYLYRAAMTHVFGVLCRRRNSSGVYSIA